MDEEVKMKTKLLIGLLLIVFISGCVPREARTFEKNLNYLNVAQETKNASMCEKITNSFIKDLCYFDVAVGTEDVSLCEKITNSSDKDKCYTNVARKIEAEEGEEKIEEAECLKEGETYMPGDGKQCCAGLEGMTITYGDGTTCTLPMGYVCTAFCGDGKCEGEYENACSCSEDCPKSEPEEISCTTNSDCGTDSCQQGRNKCIEIKYICENGKCSSATQEFPGFMCQKNSCEDSCGNGICEGEYEKLHCPQDCLKEPIPCNDSLDCPSKMKCENSVCVDVGCLEEGQTTPIVATSPEGLESLEHMATECCEGLKAIFWSGEFDENCSLKPIVVGVIGRPQEVCSNCGNGICEEWETKCNCPEDCE